MRPTPTARHVTAVALFVLVAAMFGLLAMREHDTDLFPNDPIYGDRGLWQLHTPIFGGLLKMSLVPSGYRDMVLPFRLLTGVVALIYLCGMYALLYQQCRSWSVAAYVALLSAAVLEAIPGLKWGFGSLETTGPDTLVLAMLPLILMGYLRYERQWRVVWVFGAIGLLGNLDLATASNLALVLLTVYLIRRGSYWATWRNAAMGVGAAVLAALPYVCYVVWLRIHAAGDDPASYGRAVDALELVGRQLLYPDILMALLNWRLVALLLILGTPSVLVLVGVERYRVRHQTVWLWWFTASLVLGFGLQGVSQAVFKWADRTPIVTFFDMVKLAMVPMFVLLAQALTNLFRLAAKHRAGLQWLAAAVLVVYLGPSDNLRVARYAAWETATDFLPAERRPASVQRHRRHADRHAEMMA
ncbi:MAG: hypothetical protein ACYTFO_08230, partial [Planctomycetota bacterium]